jgi:HK97 family phage major capsid protein
VRTIEELLAAMQAILTAAEGRTLTGEECDQYEALERELNDTRRHDEILARQRAYNTPTGEPVPTGRENGPTEYEQAFEAYLRTGRPNDDLMRISNAQTAGTPSEGGYLVPETFRQRIVDRMVAFGGIANAAELVTTTTGNPMPWPTCDDTANSGEIINEGGTFSGGADLVFGSASLGSYQYAAGGASSLPLRVSNTLLRDAAFDVQGFVSNKLGIRIARIQSTHLVSGTGAGEPLGIKQGLTGKQLAANTGVTYDDLLGFIHAVDPAYRNAARWAFNDTSLMVIEKIKDSNGDPLWRSMTSTMGDPASNGTLLGFPYLVDQAFPDISLASGVINWGVFGDISQGYVIRRVRDVLVVVNPWSRASYNEVEFSGFASMDATQQNTAAYTALTGKA